jgi:DUF4097 and DUF4098 domain-containing protein YvlB
MINLKKIAIIAFFLLLVGGIGSIFTFKAVQKEVTANEKKTFDNSNIMSIEVDLDNAGVELLPTKETVTTVELTGKGSKNIKKQFSAQVEGDKLVIKLKDEKWKLFRFDFLQESLKVTVSLPEKQYDLLEVDNDNGYVQLEDLTIAKINAETDNGRVEMKNVISSQVEAKTDNGRIILEQVSGEIQGKTSNGRISIVTEDLDRPMKLETNNGRIEIETEKEPTNVTFNVDVDNGRVDILNKYSGNAVIGNGDNLIELKTDNGRITVTK